MELILILKLFVIYLKIKIVNIYKLDSTDTFLYWMGDLWSMYRNQNGLIQSIYLTNELINEGSFILAGNNIQRL